MAKFTSSKPILGSQCVQVPLLSVTFFSETVIFRGPQRAVAHILDTMQHDVIYVLKSRHFQLKEKAEDTWSYVKRVRRLTKHRKHTAQLSPTNNLSSVNLFMTKKWLQFIQNWGKFPVIGTSITYLSIHHIWFRESWPQKAPQHTFAWLALQAHIMWLLKIS